MLYRNLAPISPEAWEEIDQRAAEVLKSYLSARRVVKVNGPKGLDFNVITEGRLLETQNENDVDYAKYQVQPLIETRVEFEMERWELDNIERGAKNVDYEPLEEAMKKLALFEEEAVYNGLRNGGIIGLKDAVETAEIDFGKTPTEIMDAITKGILQMKKLFVPGPYTLVVSADAYGKILSKETAYPLDQRIEELIGEKIVFNHVIDGAYLLPYNHDDLEFTIGRDFSIGYQGSTDTAVKFFATESFTFRVLDPNLIVKFK